MLLVENHHVIKTFSSEVMTKAPLGRLSTKRVFAVRMTWLIKVCDREGFDKPARPEESGIAYSPANNVSAVLTAPSLQGAQGRV